MSRRKRFSSPQTESSSPRTKLAAADAAVTASSDAASARPALRRGARVVISVLLLLHLTALFIAPFRFASATQPGSSSPLAGIVMDALRPYIDFTFLNHGYFFFAPNPGASHLVRSKATFADGRPPLEQTFPDLERQWPRLLYHRHFMLSESLNTAFVPPLPENGSAAESAANESLPPGEAALQREAWRQQRAVYEALWGSYRDHLAASLGAEHVELSRIEHRPPTPREWTLKGRRLRDADLYVELPEVIDEPFPTPSPPPSRTPRQAEPETITPPTVRPTGAAP